MISCDQDYWLREEVPLRDKCAQALEFLSQKDLRQLGEYVVDHLNDPAQVQALADYLRLHRVLNEIRTP